MVPSLYEGFSIPAVQAMSCGFPLVATTAGALPEVVGDDGETACWCPRVTPPPWRVRSAVSSMTRSCATG